MAWHYLTKMKIIHDIYSMVIFCIYSVVYPIMHLEFITEKLNLRST